MPEQYDTFPLSSQPPSTRRAKPESGAAGYLHPHLHVRRQIRLKARVAFRHEHPVEACLFEFAVEILGNLRQPFGFVGLLFDYRPCFRARLISSSAAISSLTSFD
jgi:hypothetical protein